jgi:hypothetical protein
MKLCDSASLFQARIAHVLTAGVTLPNGCGSCTPTSETPAADAYACVT